MGGRGERDPIEPQRVPPARSDGEEEEDDEDEEDASEDEEEEEDPPPPSAALLELRERHRQLLEEVEAQNEQLAAIEAESQQIQVALEAQEAVVADLRRRREEREAREAEKRPEIRRRAQEVPIMIKKPPRLHPHPRLQPVAKPEHSRLTSGDLILYNIFTKSVVYCINRHATHHHRAVV